MAPPLKKLAVITVPLISSITTGLPLVGGTVVPTTSNWQLDCAKAAAIIGIPPVWMICVDAANASAGNVKSANFLVRTSMIFNAMCVLVWGSCMRAAIRVVGANSGDYRRYSAILEVFVHRLVES